MSGKKGALCKRLNETTFNFPLYFVIGKPYQCAEYIEKKFGVDDVSMVALGQAFQTSDDRFILWIHPYDDTADWYDTLAHEVTHLVFHLLSHVGISHSTDTDELYGYLTGSLVNQCIQIARKAT